MIREKLIAHYERAGRTASFRNREISRLEGLSDAVFGFAITLLIVSLEVPKTSGELIETMRGFIAFAFTFVMLFSIWHRQFTFFRRYGRPPLHGPRFPPRQGRSVPRIEPGRAAMSVS